MCFFEPQINRRASLGTDARQLCYYGISLQPVTRTRMSRLELELIDRLTAAQAVAERLPLLLRQGSILAMKCTRGLLPWRDSQVPMGCP